MAKSVFMYRIAGIGIGIAEEVLEEGPAITGVFFGPEPKGFARKETPLIKKTAIQIEEYLAGGRREFTVPVALRGTEFQMAVWNALKAIPYGETRSYKEIAAQAGRPKAARAAGMANHRNPVSIIVPCHRVIGSGGGLTGYGGGLPLKKRLLDLERGELAGGLSALGRQKYKGKDK